MNVINLINDIRVIKSLITFFSFSSLLIVQLDYCRKPEESCDINAFIDSTIYAIRRNFLSLV